MNDAVFNLLTYLEPLLSAIAILLLFRSRSARKFSALTCFLALRLSATVICLFILRASSVLEVHLAYKLFFYVYWCSYALESILSLLVIFSVFRLAMAPLKGLQRLGTLVFRWAGAISAILAIAVTFSSRTSGAHLLRVVVTQMQEVSSILTLCLLLFVCFAIRPLGLSFRDRIFGVSFGLGIMATASLVDAAWITLSPTVHSDLSLANGIATCLTLLIWSVYFALPEKKQQIIMVPTTSPFLTWNRISEILGDKPGYVALGGISPEAFAPAEMEMMFRASAKMAELSLADNVGTTVEGEPAAQSMIA